MTAKKHPERDLEKADEGKNMDNIKYSYCQQTRRKCFIYRARQKRYRK